MWRGTRCGTWERGEVSFSSEQYHPPGTSVGSAEFLWRFHCLGMIVKEIPEGLSAQTLALSVQQTFLQGIEQDPFLIRRIAIVWIWTIPPKVCV